jgi:hypothetical protein
VSGTGDACWKTRDILGDTVRYSARFCVLCTGNKKKKKKINTGREKQRGDPFFWQTVGKLLADHFVEF